jgi:hypothetical protein
VISSSLYFLVGYYESQKRYHETFYLVFTLPVYKGTYLGTTVAVKQLFRSTYTDVKEVKAQFLHEAKVLR